MLTFSVFFCKGTFTKGISLALSGLFFPLKKIHMEIDQNSSHLLR